MFKMEKHHDHKQSQGDNPDEKDEKDEKSDDKTKKRSRLSPAQYFRIRYFGWILGFALPWTLILWIPIIGLPFFGIAQASVPTVILQILKKNRDKAGSVYLFGQDMIDEEPSVEDPKKQ